MPTPAPSPSTTPSTPDFAGTVLHGLWNGVTTVAAQQPWLIVLVALLILSALVKSAREAIHSGPRDPIRCFTGADKRVLLSLAGNRCEHHARIGGRCRSTSRLEADHVHPWSRGGSTHIGNGQILCKAHNREKSASIPFDRSLRRLADKRAAYYPPGANRAIVRKTRVG